MVCKSRDLDRGSDQREVGPSHLGQPWYVRAESSRQGVGTVHASSNFVASHYES